MGHPQRKESCNSCQSWRLVGSNDGAIRRKRNRFLFFLAVVPCLASAAGGFEAAASFDEAPPSLRSGNTKSSSWFHRLPRIFADEAETSQQQQENDDNERWLKSSDSSDGGDRGDDYYHYYDDAYKFRDDDFYKYLGDPLDPELFPMTRRDVIGFMLASIGVLLGSSGGIGGGGLVIPIFIIVNGLSPRFAIPLGSVTVFGGSLAGMILNLRRRHPLADRPIIDWDLILVMEPVVLVGALIGGILHRIVSEKILTVLLVLLLSVVAHTTLAKAKRMYDAETRYIEHLKQARASEIARICSFRSNFRQSGPLSVEAVPEGGELSSKTDVSFKMNLSPMSPSLVMPTRTGSIDSVDADERQRILILNPDFVTLRSDLLEQEKATPRSKVMALSIKFTVIMFMNLMLGGGAFKSPWGIMCGSVAYWVVHVIMVAFLLASAWAAQTYLVNRHEIKEIVCYDFVHGDIKWEPKTAVVYPSLFLGAGLCAGMLGIGGGMVCVPILLSMGVHPAVVAATSSTMVFFTAALSTSSFAVFNLILWDYAVVCIFIGFMASLFGQGLMSRAKRQSKTAGANFERNSFIAYCIGGVVLLSALLMTIQYVLEIVSYDANEAKSAGSGLCEGFRISQ